MDENPYEAPQAKPLAVAPHVRRGTPERVFWVGFWIITAWLLSYVVLALLA